MKSLAKVSPLPRTARDSDIEDVHAELEYSITKSIENSKEIRDEAELSFEEALPLGILNLGHCPKPNSGIFTIPVFDVFDLEEGAHLDLEKGGILDLEEGGGGQCPTRKLTIDTFEPSSNEATQVDNSVVDYYNIIETHCCPLTFFVFYDPVICQDGQTYERYAIQKHIALYNKSEKEAISPTDNVTVIKADSLFCNQVIKRQIDCCLSGECGFAYKEGYNYSKKMTLHHLIMEEIQQRNSKVAIIEQKKTLEAKGIATASSSLPDYNSLVYNMQETHCCPLTFCIMFDPVVCQDGQTYEKCAIVKHIALGKKKDAVSPMDNATVINVVTLVSNQVVKRQIDSCLKSGDCSSEYREEYDISKKRSIDGSLETKLFLLKINRKEKRKEETDSEEGVDEDIFMWMAKLYTKLLLVFLSFGCILFLFWECNLPFRDS